MNSAMKALAAERAARNGSALPRQTPKPAPHRKPDNRARTQDVLLMDSAAHCKGFKLRACFFVCASRSRAAPGRLSSRAQTLMRMTHNQAKGPKTDTQRANTRASQTYSRKVRSLKVILVYFRTYLSFTNSHNKKML